MARLERSNDIRCNAWNLKKNLLGVVNQIDLDIRDKLGGGFLRHSSDLLTRLSAVESLSKSGWTICRYEPGKVCYAMLCLLASFSLYLRCSVGSKIK